MNQINQKKSKFYYSAIIIIAFFGAGLACPALAKAENQSASNTSDRSQEASSHTPVKAVTEADGPNSPEPRLSREEKMMEQSLNSLDFIAGGSPLKAVPKTVDMPDADTAGLPAPASARPDHVPGNSAATAPVLPSPGTGVVTEQLRSVTQAVNNGVSMLVSESCETTGTENDGTVSCSRTYSNGNYATVLTQRALAGDELKVQTVIKEFDSTGALLFTTTIRVRTDYGYHLDKQGTEKYFLDVVHEPAGGKTTRELLIIQYNLETGKVASMSWTQYEQIGNEPRASLVYHATLRYGPDGNPLQGVAEKWFSGQRVASFLDWSSAKSGRLGFDKESWRDWETWIQGVSLQAYLL